MFQIKYFKWRSPDSETGLGIAHINLLNFRDQIKEEYKENRIDKTKYLIHQCLVEMPELTCQKGESIFSYGAGKLGIRIVNETEKGIEKITKKLDLPFSKKFVVPYLFE